MIEFVNLASVRTWYKHLKPLRKPEGEVAFRLILIYSMGEWDFSSLQIFPRTKSKYSSL